MKLLQVLAFALGSALVAQALVVPESVRALSLPESASLKQRGLLYNELERRKGGGGGGKGGSSSGGKGGSGSKYTWFEYCRRSC